MALEVFSDMSERLNYNLPGFPIYARKGELRHFDRYAAACHWHPDLEFILVLEGSMDYFVNGQILHMNKGEGIFVNGKRLHYGFSDEKTDCSFIVVVVHPFVLWENTPVGKAFCELKFGFNADDYILLKTKTSWQVKILALIKQIFEEINRSEENPLYILSLVTALCACTAENLQLSSGERNNNLNAKSWVAIRKMTGFIFKNYGNKITLDDIAAAGSVCRSKCCRLFGEYIGQTPNTYLTGYRIRKSCEMLKDSNMTVLEVSMSCGFQSPSYFTYIFQKEIGLTPKEYRNQLH
jgi:AraC family transcriptional regulator, melibiose operon regulatory protein